jgi:hypothetical protein
MRLPTGLSCPQGLSALTATLPNTRRRSKPPAGSPRGYRITPTHLNIGTITKMTATATVEALGFDALITKP